ncbi:MAG TPA: GH3 auxin-responsive promoter family protein [Dehalococcoidales bacterium]|nr:GH3 auxin-responsive promoter family protein [Dehalococcoidales bacterium]
MQKAVDLLRQGKRAEIWDMCCGYLKLDIDGFMSVQKSLLLEQIKMLNQSKIGRKLFKGNWPESVEDFRREVPLTTYADFVPELSEKRLDSLPGEPGQWVHTSGRTGEYTCKWVPITDRYATELSRIVYGIGLISAASRWGDHAPFLECPKLIYTVAPRPYVSGALASMLQEQTPTRFYPALAQAENMSFEERIRLAFQEALAGGLDYFFGLSLVLSSVGAKFSQSSGKINLKPYLKQPKAMARLARGVIKSRMAGRALLPKDLWKVRGIICSGLDSGVYKDKIKHYWGRYPLDIYASTEGGIIATQTWDYQDMTFIPNLNFLEFVPEREHLKWRADRQYKPKTLLLNELQSGECYEIVLTNFHGGSLVRYRIGDMIRITSLTNERANIKLPQMVFERRCDDLIDFVVIRLTEKTIWRAIEKIQVPYVDWVAFKNQGEPVLTVLLETAPGFSIREEEITNRLYQELINSDSDSYTNSEAHNDLADMIKFQVKVNLLPHGTFARYSAQKQAEGADLAHLKPPHVNPPQKVLTMLKAPVPVKIETASPVTSQGPPVKVG